jgi:hypothetical protein
VAFSINQQVMGTAEDTTTVTASITLGSNSSRKLIAILLQGTNYGFGRATTSIVFDPGGGDQATLTILEDQPDNTDQGERDLQACVAYLDETDIPTSGTYDITATSTDSSDGLFLRVFEMFDAVQGAPSSSSVGAEGSQTAFDLDVSSTSGDICIDGLVGTHSGRAFTVGGGQNQEYQGTTGDSLGLYAYSTETATSGTTGMDWSSASAHSASAHVAVAITGLAAEASPGLLFRHLE